MSGPEKAVLTYLALHGDGPDGRNCRPSTVTLADETCLGLRTVKRALASLEDKGFIVRSGEYRTRNGGKPVVVWTIALDVLEDTASDESATAARSKVPESPKQRARAAHDLPLDLPIDLPIEDHNGDDLQSSPASPAAECTLPRWPKNGEKIATVVAAFDDIGIHINHDADALLIWNTTARAIPDSRRTTCTIIDALQTAADYIGAEDTSVVFTRDSPIAFVLATVKAAATGVLPETRFDADGTALPWEAIA